MIPSLKYTGTPGKYFGHVAVLDPGLRFVSVRTAASESEAGDRKRLTQDETEYSILHTCSTGPRGRSCLCFHRQRGMRRCQQSPAAVPVRAVAIDGFRCAQGFVFESDE